MKIVDSGSNCAATRNTLALRPPHNPLSAAMRMTARRRTSRTSRSGCVKSEANVVACRWMRYNALANGPAAIAACCALRIFEAATICIALVICAVPRIDVMRRRRPRPLLIARSA